MQGRYIKGHSTDAEEGILKWPRSQKLPQTHLASSGTRTVTFEPAWNPENRLELHGSHYVYVRAQVCKRECVSVCVCVRVCVSIDARPARPGVARRSFPHTSQHGYRHQVCNKQASTDTGTKNASMHAPNQCAAGSLRINGLLHSCARRGHATRHAR